MTKLRRLGLLLITMACVQPAPAQQSLPTTELTINGHRVAAEVATTVATRAVGLMRRFSLLPDHGCCSYSSAAAAHVLDEGHLYSAADRISSRRMVAS